MAVRAATTQFVNAKKNEKIQNGIHALTRTVSNLADACTIVMMMLNVKLIALINLKVVNKTVLVKTTVQLDVRVMILIVILEKNQAGSTKLRIVGFCLVRIRWTLIPGKDPDEDKMILVISSHPSNKPIFKLDFDGNVV